MIRDSKIQTKILLVKIPFILTLIIVIIISVTGTVVISRNGDELYNLAECANKLSRMQGIVFQRQRLMRSVGFVIDNEKEVKDIVDTLTANNDQFVQYISELKNNLNYNEAQIILDEIERNYDSFFEEWALYLSFVAAKDAQRVTDASFNAGEGGLELQLLCESLADVLALQTDLLKTSIDQYELLISCCIIIFSITALITAVLFGRHIAGLITKPIGQILISAENLAVGNTDSKAAIQSKDEMGDLAQSFNKMVQAIHEQVQIIQTIAQGDYTVKILPRNQKDIMNASLAELIRQNSELLSEVQKASSEVSSLSGQVANASQNLASGASEQASNIEDLSAALQHILEEAQNNEESASENAANGRLLYTTFTQSNQYIDKMKDAMDVIYSASDDVAQIIRMIRDIAFQSNILAINAAIEASHTEGNRKGFVVIANEYRNFSMSIQDAANQSAELIDKCLTSIHQGGSILDDMLNCLLNVERYQTVHTSLTEKLLKASERQHDAIQEINKVFVQIKEVVFRNSSTSEETAVIAEELDAQVQHLNNLIHNFKFDGK